VSKRKVYGQAEYKRAINDGVNPEFIELAFDQFSSPLLTDGNLEALKETMDLQDQLRAAQNSAAYEARRANGAYEWANATFEDLQSLQARLEHVCAVALSHGATPEELI